MRSGCLADVLLLLPGSALLHSGLLSSALLLGACFGLVAATLLHIFVLKPFFLIKKFKGYDPWSLLEVEQLDEENRSDRMGRKTAPSEAVKKHWQKQTEPVNSDVAAFALKAKVVYPINQRYRPLADGASNPSLHEHSTQPDQDSFLSADDWLSQEREEDKSSQDICSEPLNKTQQSQSFRRVQHFAHTLCYTGIEGKVSLLCVTLQNLYLQTSLLHHEKWSIFMQILRVLLSRNDTSLQHHLHQQEKKIEQLKKNMCPELLSWENGEQPGSVFCSIEEVEKAGSENFRHTLQLALNFAKQLEQLCQHLQSSTPNEVTQEMIHTFIRCLLSVEKHLVDLQTSFMKTLCDRLQWWEELSGWVRIRMSLLRQEAELRVKLTTQTLEELTADGQLGFGHMEKLISDLQTLVSEELQHCSDEIKQQTVDMVCEYCRKLNVKMRKMKKTQTREWCKMLDDHQHRDAEQLTEIMKELQVKHWKQKTDLELQHDRRISDAVCGLWKKVLCDFSGHLSALWRECVLCTLNTDSTLSVDDCWKLLNNTELTMSSLLQQSHTHQDLHMLRNQLAQGRQIWMEEEVLAESGIKHLAKQHMKVALAAVPRQVGIHDRKLIERKQCLLLVEIQRILKARHFYIKTVKEMKLTQLKLQLDTQVHTFVIGQNFQQEHLSELETTSEVLQEHTQFLIGLAFANSTRLRLVNSTPDNMAAANDEHKARLMEAVCKNVYVTRDSVTPLILNYYFQIQTAITAMKHTQQHTKMRERQQKKEGYVKALQKELRNWARKPHSAEFYRRVEQQKRLYLSQCEEEGVWDDQRGMIDLQHQIDTIQKELRVEEDHFLSRLAALARVPEGHKNKNNLAAAD